MNGKLKAEEENILEPWKLLVLAIKGSGYKNPRMSHAWVQQENNKHSKWL